MEPSTRLSLSVVFPSFCVLPPPVHLASFGILRRFLHPDPLLLLHYSIFLNHLRFSTSHLSEIVDFSYPLLMAIFSFHDSMKDPLITISCISSSALPCFLVPCGHSY